MEENGKITWRRKGQPTLVFLTGKSHGQGSLAGYSPWDLRRVRHELATKQQFLFSPQTLYVTTYNVLNLAFLP